ncbi:hypothetical protein EDD85DRAFT_65629 [Armillaria nabsnona]|nr:hypothetical protein EDD85DRAFT_65629 [Armillaria nabsnona]
MDKRYRFCQIKEWDKRSYYLKIFAGNVYEKTKTYKVKKKDRGTTSTPRWTLDLDLRGINESERFQVEVYCRRGKGEYQCLGFCGASIQDVSIGETDIIAVSISSNSSCPNVSLKIFREGASDYSAITQSASEDLDMSAAPQSGPSNIVVPESQDTSGLSGLEPEEIPARSVEDYCAAAGRVVEETVEPTEPPGWISTLIDGIDTAKGMIDAVKDLHPAAAIAWGIVSSCVNVLKQTTERDKIVLRLYKAMITTYKEASDDRLLWQVKQLEPIYKALFQTTNECGMLIMRYTNKNRVRRFFSLDVSQKAEEFIQGFANLRVQLDSGVAKDALVVTLGVRANVDMLTMKKRLRELRPRQMLGPKSTCLPGTRVETINALSSWIMECNDDVLWCSGLAGTGKSSVVGTLYNLLSFHLSSYSQLAAFIRYDRTEYWNSSELITSIAYSLGMFDQRIGNAIAKALTASRAALKMPASESRTQFRLLLQEPLEMIPKLRDERPLVVIIDGLDESDVSEDLLEVLADGFGPTLPFMRFIVFSRPEEKISCVFKKRQHGLHQYPLDTSSDEVKQDILYFIWQRFASIKDKSVWGTYNEQYVVTLLAERASGLFIWAATVCSFLCKFPSLWRLRVLLKTPIPANAMEALTILYQTALDTIVSEIGSGDEDIRQCIRAVLGVLIVRKGSITVSMLSELVLQEEDPPAQTIIGKLGSVVEERSGCLELIHKSFDDFLQDYNRCGRWFIDIKQHEMELARRCMLSLTQFLKNWTPRCAHLKKDHAQPALSSLEWYPRVKLLELYHDIPSHIQDYAVNVLDWHLDALIELGIKPFHSLFEHCFLPFIEIFHVFSSTSDRYKFVRSVLLRVISLVNVSHQCSTSCYGLTIAFV